MTGNGNADTPDHYDPVVVRPGDKLVVVSKDRLTMQRVERIRDELERYLPGVEVGVIDGVDQLAVYRADVVAGRRRIDLRGSERDGPGGRAGRISAG